VRKKTDTTFRLAALVLSMSITAACEDTDEGSFDQKPTPSVESDRPLLQLGKADEDTVSLSFVRGSDQAGPRMMELFVELSPELAFVEAEAGDATINAKKQLVAQDQGNGLVRLVLYSTGDLNTFDTGEVARIQVERADGKPGKVSLRTDRPLFAPLEASQGLLVADPLTL
jgi:hypothetical protein